MQCRYIDPVAELGGLLLNVEKPSRYVGGEVGILAKRGDEKDLCALIAFPDLYEIGMGNQALRIIYNRLNAVEGVSCDRAFAPAPDFEKLLRENNIPLYGLDTGVSLASVDLLMFTLGYELGLSGVLSMLDVSGIPLRNEERKNKKEERREGKEEIKKKKEEREKNFDEYPIIIAGGPAVSNPLPYSPFIDAFWIGEAEAGFFDLVKELSILKKRGESRAALLEKISSHTHIWTPNKKSGKAKRAIAVDFSLDETAAVYPIPSMKIVHHHGVVEIMRGCPNGCRFCHAGYWYRPARQKSINRIARAANDMVTKGGWHEISLSSLSSGDYNGVDELVETLNNMFVSQHVSFQLPSLKVSSFSLELLEKISVTRKSGLTFAVETPRDAWQIFINKEVTRDSVVAILDEAKKKGWKGAKFYFMIGLPLPAANDAQTEEEEIVSFIIDIARRTRMHFNINVGIFVPKPHTPYQWAPQIDSDTAVKKLNFIRSKLKPMGHKVSISDPLISMLEGLLSRGDERAGLLCEEAYKGGSRLDAWSEYINKEIWLKLLEENRKDVNGVLYGKEKLPWEGIDSRITPEYMSHELEKSNNAVRSQLCNENCSICGVCSKKPNSDNSLSSDEKTPSCVFLSRTNDEKADTSGISDTSVNQTLLQVNENDVSKKADPSIYRILFSFSKDGSAVFHGHLSLIEIFSMAFARAKIPVMYSLGFNPLAKIEFASPLTTGIGADFEIAAADFTCQTDQISAERFTDSLNESFPQGIRIIKAEGFNIPGGAKKHSLSSLLWGFSYKNGTETDYVKFGDDKKYRQNRLEKEGSSLFSLRREAVLSKNVTGGENEWISYFDAYRFYYC